MDASGILKVFLLTVSVGFTYCGGVGPDLMPEIDANIRSMKNCTEKNNYTMLYRDVQVEKTGKNTYSVGATLVTLAEIAGPVKIANKVDACGTVQKPNCQFFTEFISEDACDDLDHEKGSLYKTLKKVKMEHIRCPIPPNEMVMQPFALKLPEEAKTMVARSELWEVEQTMSHGDEILACVKITVEIKPRGNDRQKNRKGKKKD